MTTDSTSIAHRDLIDRSAQMISENKSVEHTQFSKFFSISTSLFDLMCYSCEFIVHLCQDDGTKVTPTTMQCSLISISSLSCLVWGCKINVSEPILDDGVKEDCAGCIAWFAHQLSRGMHVKGYIFQGGRKFYRLFSSPQHRKTDPVWFTTQLFLVVALQSALNPSKLYLLRLT